MDLKLINKDTVIDAFVNRCNTLYILTTEQRAKLQEKDRIIFELTELIKELANEKIFKSNINKQK